MLLWASSEIKLALAIQIVCDMQYALILPQAFADELSERMLRQDRLGARLSFNGPVQKIWADICKTTTLEAERKSEQFSSPFDANCGPDAFL